VVSLQDELNVAAAAAEAFAERGEELTGVVAAEPATGLRLYVCAYRRDESFTWLALDGAGRPVADRALVRDAVSIVGLCEIAEETAGGGDVEALRGRLAELRETESPEGIEQAEAAATALAATLAEQPRVASLEYLDAIGSAATRLEHALGEIGGSPFAHAMKVGSAAVGELTGDVERNYKQPLG
jgi:hypothetical protein